MSVGIPSVPMQMEHRHCFCATMLHMYVSDCAFAEFYIPQQNNTIICAVNILRNMLRG